MSSVNTDEISINAVHALRDKLRALNKSWVTLLAPNMKITDDELEQNAQDRIYNICKGLVSSQEMRTLFITEGMKLLTSLKKKQKPALDMAKQLEKDLNN